MHFDITFIKWNTKRKIAKLKAGKDLAVHQ